MGRTWNDRISLKEACELVGVSRPTFNTLRAKHRLKEVKVGERRIYFSRIEIIKKVLLPEEQITEGSYLILNRCDVDSLEVSGDVFDLRGVVAVDEFGAMSLLCLLKKRMRDSERVIVVLAKNSVPCQNLKVLGFFEELRRGTTHLFVNDEEIEDLSLPAENVLKLHNLGYRGAEKKLLDHLYDSLLKQGFSENLVSRLGWTLGELADNAHTHAGGPCYLTIMSRTGEPDDPKFLCMSVGDIGEGISTTLRANPKYSNLTSREALYSAFKTKFTRWSDDAERGKGLVDLLCIGKGNRAWVRVESNGISLFFDFKDGPNGTVIEDSAATKTVGTRFSLVLIDAEFKEVTRKEIDMFIDECLGRRG